MSTKRYTVDQANIDGFEVFTLRDIKRQASAKIIPKLGNNCYSFTQTVGTESINFIEPPPDLRHWHNDHPATGIPYYSRFQTEYVKGISCLKASHIPLIKLQNPRIRFMDWSSINHFMLIRQTQMTELPSFVVLIQQIIHISKDSFHLHSSLKSPTN